MDLDNVTRTISVVQSEAQILPQEESITLDTAQFAETLRQGRAVEAVDMIRHILDTAEYGGLISAQALHSVRQDVMQILFAYLMQEHILAHELFEDRNAKQLEATCSNSVFDMLKWVDYIVKRAIDTVAQARQGECVVEKVKRYIEENCCKGCHARGGRTVRVSLSGLCCPPVQAGDGEIAAGLCERVSYYPCETNARGRRKKCERDCRFGGLR